MKCCVVKNAKGDVVAAYPVDVEGVRLEMELKKGESKVEMEIAEEDMRDPERFLRACVC